MRGANILAFFSVLAKRLVYKTVSLQFGFKFSMLLPSFVPLKLLYSTLKISFLHFNWIQNRVLWVLCKGQHLLFVIQLVVEFCCWDNINTAFFSMAVLKSGVYNHPAIWLSLKGCKCKQQTMGSAFERFCSRVTFLSNKIMEMLLFSSLVGYNG